MILSTKHLRCAKSSNAAPRCPAKLHCSTNNAPMHHRRSSIAAHHSPLQPRRRAAQPPPACYVAASTTSGARLRSSCCVATPAASLRWWTASPLPAEQQWWSSMARSTNGREDFGKVEGNDGRCATNWRAQGRSRRASRASASTQMRPKFGPGGSAGGRKANARPFKSVRWADFSVHADPNERARTKWIGALELL